MLYPRHDDKGKLVNDEQMVGIREHLAHQHRVLFLSGSISGDTEAHNLLLAYDSLNHDPIKIVITSPGGDLDSAFLLYDTLRLIRSPIWTLGRYCASAAVLIMAAGQQRLLSPHCKVMLHLPQTLLGGGLFGAGFKEEDLRVIHSEAAKYRSKMVDALIECGATKSADEIMRDIKDADFWLEPEEAIEYGLADGIMTQEDLRRWF